MLFGESMRGITRRWLVIGLHASLGILFLLPALIIGLGARARYAARPAVLVGVTPIITKKYWAKALRKAGYQSVSFVYGVYSVNSPIDFDYMPERLFPKLSRIKRAHLVLPYLCFLWALINFEVFIMDFDGRFLRSTPFRFLEFPMYTLARRKVIAIPYGSDILDLRRCRDTATRVAIVQDYPRIGTNYREVERRVKHYARWASFIITGGIWLDFLPRFDLVVTNVAAIDVDEWSDKPRKGGKGFSFKRWSDQDLARAQPSSHQGDRVPNSGLRRTSRGRHAY
jgi:hypothetical protein